MNDFVQKFKGQIDSFWNDSEDEKNRLLGEILEYANFNPTKFKNEISAIKFDQDLMALPIISEALSKDTDNWGQFYIDLLNDILEAAKQSDKPRDILNNLQEFAYIEKDRRPFVQEIVDRLSKELNSENLDIKLAAIWTLPTFLANNHLKNKNVIIARLREQLYDRNWKVRVVAFRSLGFENLLPEGQKLSLKDRLARLIFGDPPII